MSTEFHLDQHPAVLLTPEIAPPYAWVGHIPFAYLAIDLLRPRQVVELGTHSGNSYLAFCQAVQHLGLSTRCWAVDWWQGDRHAHGYGDHVYEDLKARHDRRYGAFSQLLRSEFSAAVDRFDDASIDLLHIDGLHTYEAVRRDFQQWLPKLSDRAVVLFHDSNHDDSDFGVERLLTELGQSYPSFAFTHSHGLTALAVGERLPSAFVGFLRAAQARPAAIRGFFEGLAARLIDPVSEQPRIAPVTTTRNCELRYRLQDQSYDDVRMLRQPAQPLDGAVGFEFELPAGVHPDYIRIDPIDMSGLFELHSLYWRPGLGAVEAPQPLMLDARLGMVNGSRLPCAAPTMVQVLSFDQDPYIEIAVADLEHGPEPSRIRFSLSYRALAKDSAVQHYLERQYVALRPWLGHLQELADSRSQTRQVASLSAQIEGLRSDLIALTPRLEAQRREVVDWLLSLQPELRREWVWRQFGDTDPRLGDLGWLPPPPEPVPELIEVPESAPLPPPARGLRGTFSAWVKAGLQSRD